MSNDMQANYQRAINKIRTLINLIEEAIFSKISISQSLIDQLEEIHHLLLQDSANQNQHEFLSHLKKIREETAKIYHNNSNRDDLSNTEQELIKNLFELGLKIEEDRARLAEKSQNFSSFFLKEKENTAYLRAEIKILKEKLKDISDQANTINEANQNLIETYDNTIQNLTQKDNEVTKLVGLVTKKSISGSFEQSAIYEKKEADRFRTNALVLMVALISISCFTLYETIKDGVDLENIIFRAVLALILLIPTTYLAKESAKHRQQQRNHHEKSLILTAVDPFIETLGEKEKISIKTEVASKLFSIKNNNETQSDEALAIAKLLTAIIEAFKNNKNN